MNSIFVIMLPSILGIKTIELLVGERNNKEIIKDYLNILLLSNYISIALIAIVNKFEYNLIDYINDNMLFAFKYLSISIVISIILGFIFSILIKNVKISLEVKNEKERKSNK